MSDAGRTEGEEANGETNGETGGRNGEAVLQCLDVGKRYGGLAALSHVNFEVYPGEVFAVIGPNGAGKSTLFDVVSGVSPATSGHVVLDGADVTRRPPHRINQLGVARVFQTPLSFPSQTVFTNVLVGAAFGAAPGPSWRRFTTPQVQRTMAALQSCELLDRQDDLAAELPLLEVKRMMFASALASDPRLLLLDEPFAGLNRDERTQLVDLVRRVNEQGVAVLLIEHIIESVRELATRMLVLHHGSKIIEGAPAQVLADPLVATVYLGQNAQETQNIYSAQNATPGPDPVRNPLAYPAPASNALPGPVPDPATSRDGQQALSARGHESAPVARRARHALTPPMGEGLLPAAGTTEAAAGTATRGLKAGSRPVSGLRVSGVSGGYGGSKVLHDVSLTVEPGESVVLLGPNGHGKTTLLRAISGMIPLTAGSVEVGGVSLQGRTPSQIAAAGIVHVPQGDLPFPTMTVRENLLMGAYIGASWRERAHRLERVHALFPRLAEREGQLAKSLSGGERRMLAIGRGLMGNAQVLLIDEPSLGLAPQVIDDVYAAIKDIADSGYSLLIVDESAERVGEVADRIYAMSSGRIRHEGTPADLLGSAALTSAYLD